MSKRLQGFIRKHMGPARVRSQAHLVQLMEEAAHPYPHACTASAFAKWMGETVTVPRSAERAIVVVLGLRGADAAELHAIVEAVDVQLAAKRHEARR